MMKRLARMIPIVFAIGVSLAGVYLAFVLFAPDSIVYWPQIHQGNRVTREIDTYRLHRGRLPSSLSDIGEPDTEAGPIYYQRCSDAHYILYFGTPVLGKSMSFDSADQSWVSLNLVCPEQK